ncbi:MAG: phosphoribosylanthranilate isomerase [Proteobacteria bacterium]|nr:phosphoribosylanthranilate isomerase [Pseudomonadota bacterium]
MRTRVKFCGMTNPADAHAAAAAGADAIGFVLYPPAKVAIDARTAAAIAATMPPFVEIVALFVNATAAEIRQTIDILKPHTLQFHGEEPADFCCNFGLPYIKSCHVQSTDDIRRTAAAHPHCRALLLDTYVAGVAGGSGQSFDWQKIPANCPHPLIVAGGLTAANVGTLINQVHPWAVDASSGIACEDNRRQKNYDKIADFMRSVQDADSNQTN